LLSIPSFLAATTCDSTKGLNAFNPACTDKKLPYCRLTDSTDPANLVYSCVACKSNCDCGLSSFCSVKPTQVGKCIHFSKTGQDCRPLSQTQLLDRTYPDSWKCAYVYIDAVTNSTVIDQAGVCVGQTCKQCDYIKKTGGLRECGVADGLDATRTCIYPGNLHDPHTAVWNSKVYYENPVAVWQGVYYPFFMIIFAVQIAMLVIQVLRCRGGGGFSMSRGDKQGTEMATTKHATVPQPQSNHASISPSTYDSPPAEKDPPPYNTEKKDNSRPSSSQIQYLKEEPS